MVANGDVAAVKHYRIDIDDDMFAQVNTMSMIAVKRRRNHRCFGNVGYQFFECSMVVRTLHVCAIETCASLVRLASTSGSKKQYSSSERILSNSVFMIYWYLSSIACGMGLPPSKRSDD